MVKGFRYSFIILLLCVFACSCSSLPHKQQAAISKAFYAEQDALKAGRVDLAVKYGAQAQRLIAPPKKRIAVKPVITNGNHYVVLPQEFSGTPALAIGSQALTTLAEKDNALAGQLRAEDKAIEKTTAETDKVVIAEAKEVEKAETKDLLASHSFWGRVKFWGTVAAIVAALGVLCYFFPPAIPFVLGAFRWVVAEVFTVVHWLYLAVISQFQKKG